MTEDLDDLFDALLALRMDWQAARDGYRSTLARHLRLGLDVVGGRVDVLAGLAADVVRFSGALQQIDRCLQDVDGILEIAEEARVARTKLVPPSSTGGSPQGDGGPS